MNHEAISQVFFSTSFTVAPAYCAAALFSTTVHGACHADRMAPMMGSAVVLAQLQSVCVDAVHAEIDWTREIVLGASVRMEHLGSADAGDIVMASGFVIGLEDHAVRFHVDARVGERAVAAGILCFAIVERAPEHQFPAVARLAANPAAADPAQVVNPTAWAA